MPNVASFNDHKHEAYIMSTIDGFLNDPPESDYQRAYLAAMIAVVKETFPNSGCQSTDGRKIPKGTIMTYEQALALVQAEIEARGIQPWQVAPGTIEAAAKLLLNATLTPKAEAMLAKLEQTDATIH